MTEFKIFLIIILGLLTLFGLGVLVLGYFQNKDGCQIKISFQEFHFYYRLNPDPWTLFNGYVRYEYDVQYHNGPGKEHFWICFPFVDYLIYGLCFMNAFALIDIQRILADLLGVNVGRYIHTANNFHAYERDWDRLDKFHSRIISTRNSADLTMSYKDDWKDLMDDANPHILEKMTQQMKKYDIHHIGYFVGPLDEVIKRELGE